jgi:P27 family predicted phage terminase small subunit
VIVVGRAGRAPKPTALRIIEGDKHTERYNFHEPMPRATLPVCPDDVSDDVRAIWDYTVGELDAMGIAYSCDRDTLRCYCEAVVAHRRSSAIVAQTGVLVKGLHGNWVRNPALVIQRDSAYVVRQFAQEFGLTPSARTRIENKDGAGHGEDNPFAGTG